MPERGFTEASTSLESIFLDELRSRRPGAQQALETLKSQDFDLTAADSLTRFFHTIAGSAGTAGHPTLGRLASVCEVVSRLRIADASAQVHVLYALEQGLAAAAEILDLPRAAPSAAESSIASNLEGSRSKADVTSPLPRILVVDDDPVSATLAGNALEGAGLEYVWCRDGSRTLAVMETEVPDLVLLDLLMPGVGGLEVCRWIRQHPRPLLKTTPIVIVTHQGAVDQRVAGLEAGANDYLPKPYSPAELVARVRAQLSLQATLREMAMQDGLTGCFNHGYFKSRLQQELRRTARQGKALAVALLDVDFFKEVNDRYGHPAGDAVLVQLGALLRGACRNADVVARYGGEEFGLLLLGAETAQTALVTARIRESVEKRRFVVPEGSKTQEISITVSFGVAMRSPQDDAQSIIGRTDAALYEAKRAGRNRVWFANEI